MAFIGDEKRDYQCDYMRARRAAPPIDRLPWLAAELKRLELLKPPVVAVKREPPTPHQGTGKAQPSPNARPASVLCQATVLRVPPNAAGEGRAISKPWQTSF